MDTSKIFKKVLNWLIAIFIIFLIAYIGYRIYNAALENAIKRIRKEVSKEVISTINPFKWPEKIFGHKRKKKDSDESKNQKDS